jgi:hypothetical protein
MVCFAVTACTAASSPLAMPPGLPDHVGGHARRPCVFKTSRGFWRPASLAGRPSFRSVRSRLVQTRGYRSCPCGDRPSVSGAVLPASLVLTGAGTLGQFKFIGVSGATGACRLTRSCPATGPRLPSDQRVLAGSVLQASVGAKSAAPLRYFSSDRSVAGGQQVFQNGPRNFERRSIVWRLRFSPHPLPRPGRQGGRFPIKYSIASCRRSFDPLALRTTRSEAIS